MRELKANTQPQRQSLSAPALRTFFRIAAAWGLTNEQQMNLLGITSRSTFFKWKKDKDGLVQKDTLERLSYIFGIYKALQILLPNPTAADSWIKKPNSAPLFQNQSALDRMLSGNVSDIYLVRQYLDAQRGG